MKDDYIESFWVYIMVLRYLKLSVTVFWPNGGNLPFWLRLKRKAESVVCLCVTADQGTGEHQREEEGAPVLLPLQPEGQGSGSGPPVTHGDLWGPRRGWVALTPNTTCYRGAPTCLQSGLCWMMVFPYWRIWWPDHLLNTAHLRCAYWTWIKGV